MKRCPTCGEMNPEANRFCGNCGTELSGMGDRPDVVRGAEQFLYDLVKGAARTFFELREQIESTRWTAQGRDTVDQTMTRLKDAVDAGRREYEQRRPGPEDTDRTYTIPVTDERGPTPIPDVFRSADQERWSPTTRETPSPFHPAGGASGTSGGAGTGGPESHGAGGGASTGTGSAGGTGGYPSTGSGTGGYGTTTSGGGYGTTGGFGGSAGSGSGGSTGYSSGPGGYGGPHGGTAGGPAAGGSGGASTGPSGGTGGDPARETDERRGDGPGGSSPQPI